MPKRLDNLITKTVNVEEKPFTTSVSMSCFRITISAAENFDGGATVELLVAPELKSGYELIVDYEFVVADKTLYIEKDKWRDEEKLQTIIASSPNVSFRLSLNVVQVLAPQDLNVSTSFRNLNILTSDLSFFVNATQLKQLGGRLFRDWYDRECQGEASIVVLSLDSKELSVLLEACCAYSTPTIHRRNLGDLLAIAEREKITGILRLAETFIVESESIHPIRKLEYAAEFWMSRLAESVLRSLGSRFARLDLLFDYLTKNGETFEQVHLDVLTMLDIHPDYIVL